MLPDHIRDMVICVGEKVFPAEVENILRTHPGVADVAVIGVRTRFGVKRYAPWSSSRKAKRCELPAWSGTCADTYPTSSAAHGRVAQEAAEEPGGDDSEEEIA